MGKLKIGLIFAGSILVLSTGTFLVVKISSPAEEVSELELVTEESSDSGPFPSDTEEEALEEEVVEEETPPEEEPEAEDAPEEETDDNCLLYPVGKDNALPSGFEPPSSSLVTVSGSYKLRSDAASALTDMLAAASAKGHTFSVRSAYRSRSTQESTFERWVQHEMGKGYSRSEAEQRASVYSAKPGHSEHQIGSAADIVLPRLNNEFTQDMWGTPEVNWLKQNAHKYGFVISYPEGKQSITGYKPEPWHVRWIGTSHATTLWNQNYLSSSNNITPENYLSRL